MTVRGSFIPCLVYIHTEDTDAEDSANETSATNETTTEPTKKKKAKTPKKEKPEVKESTVKVNLTSDVTVLDLPTHTEASTRVSTSK